MENLHDALVEQLRDLYSAETQLVDALPKMAQGAISDQLRSALEDHLEKTRTHVSRLEQLARDMNEDLQGHTCKAMKGLIKEGEDVLAEEYDIEALKDVQIVAAAQRVEHYEIAGYGNAIALAQYLDMPEVVSILEMTIEEEGDADKSLTQLCEKTLFDACDKKNEQ